jgi:hypothetical protein
LSHCCHIYCNHTSTLCGRQISSFCFIIGACHTVCTNHNVQLCYFQFWNIEFCNIPLLNCIRLIAPFLSTALDNVNINFPNSVNQTDIILSFCNQIAYRIYYTLYLLYFTNYTTCYILFHFKCQLPPLYNVFDVL